jgi:phospholipid-binding lipoprotein MlaA
MRSIRHPLAIAGCLLLGACATLPPNSQRDARDPLERYNRAMYSFNRALDKSIALPVARGYVKVVPQPVRQGVHNFLTNLSYPVTLVNDALQGKLAAAGSDLGRFTVNTLLGLGLFDPATAMGLAANDEDFGQTLGRWGVAPGPYFMLPILGPSTIRDTVGRVPDEYTTPRHYIRDSTVKWGITAVDLIDTRVSLLDQEDLLRQSFDEYSFVRNAWLRRRDYKVHDGNVPDESLESPESPESPPAPAP